MQPLHHWFNFSTTFWLSSNMSTQCEVNSIDKFPTLCINTTIGFPKSGMNGVPKMGWEGVFPVNIPPLPKQLAAFWDFINELSHTNWEIFLPEILTRRVLIPANIHFYIIFLSSLCKSRLPIPLSCLVKFCDETFRLKIWWKFSILCCFICVMKRKPLMSLQILDEKVTSCVASYMWWKGSILWWFEYVMKR